MKRATEGQLAFWWEFNKQLKYRWYRYRAWESITSQKFISCLVGLGISESDIRDMRWVMNYDLYEVRLWNHRKILVSGQMVYENSRD